MFSEELPGTGIPKKNFFSYYLCSISVFYSFTILIYLFIYLLFTFFLPLCSASRYLLQKLSNEQSGHRLSSLGGKPTVSVKVDVHMNDDGSVNASVSGAEPSSSTSSSTSSSGTTSTATSTATPSSTKPSPVRDTTKTYSPAEVATHNKESDCWVIVNGQVLDVTNFLKDHPGGKKAILIYAGRDATEEFNMLHNK